MARVSWLGETGASASARVMCTEIRRMYMRPAQCSPLRRSSSPAGWLTVRSSGIDGLDIILYGVPDLIGVEFEVLEDGEAARPGVRRPSDHLHELRYGQV